MQYSKQHFPNLDALRAIAALSVIASHIELIKDQIGLKQIVSRPLLLLSGSVPVTLFFVISGFLITFLLLKEKEISQDINIKSFYVRRVLRIWPLFYLVIAILYIIVPIYFPSQLEHVAFQSILLNGLFLTNFAMSLNLLPPFGANVWTIGVEEQFYIIWPLIIKFSSSKKLITRLFIIMVFIYAIKIILLFFKQKFALAGILQTTWGFSRFNCMVTGAFAAVLISEYGQKNSHLKKTYLFLSKRITQYFAYLLLLIFLIVNAWFSVPVNHQLYAILFAIIIVNLATNKNSIIKIDTPWLNYLGKISYGIYLLHYLVTQIIIHAIAPSFVSGSILLNNILIYVSVPATTIIIASFLYFFYELPFLRLKNKLSGRN